MVLVTTSWDDGHPLDLQVADLLDRYGLQGTFYVPARSALGREHIHALSARFEIGAHGVDHRRYTDMTDEEARQDLAASKAAVEDATGRPCASWCFPEGRFHGRHLGMVCQAGFTAARTVELFSTDLPALTGGVRLVPATLQVARHSRLRLLRNVVRRRKWRRLRHAALPPSSWTGQARYWWKRAASSGGVFHLWGHSAEIEELGLWRELDEILRLISDSIGPSQAVTNGGLCDHAMRLAARSPLPEVS